MTSVVLDDAIPLSSSTAWDWQPDKGAWFQNIRVLADHLHVPPELDVDPTALRAAVKAAADADAEAEWLYHPAVSPLSRPRVGHRQAMTGMLHLAVWMAAHGANLGQVTVPIGFHLWTPQGVVALVKGRQSLARLGSVMLGDVDGPAISVDLFDIILGLDGQPGVEKVGHKSPFSNESISEYFIALSFLERSFSSIFDWVKNVARMVVPFRPISSTTDFRSASDPEIAGLIRLDFGCGLLLTLEALVHESAHNYFYLTEAKRAIVAANHGHRRFLSPLKTRPRPLRGVMLAYHALAYIVLLYDALDQFGAVTNRSDFRLQYARLWAAAADAEATCMAARSFLTESGREFLDHTSNRVFRHASRP